MTEDQIEAAARELCRMRGEDPEGMRIYQTTEPFLVGAIEEVRERLRQQEVDAAIATQFKGMHPTLGYVAGIGTAEYWARGGQPDPDAPGTMNLGGLAGQAPKKPS